MSRKDYSEDAPLTLNVTDQQLASVSEGSQLRTTQEILGLSGLLESQEESEKSIRDHIHLFYKRKWPILAFLLLGVVVAGLYAKTLTPIFQTSATIEIGDGERNWLDSIGERHSSYGVGNEVYSTETEILKSRSLAKALVERMELEKSPHFRENHKSGLVSSLIMRLLPDDLVNSWVAETPSQESRAGHLATQIQNALTVERLGYSRLLKLSYEDKDPVFARDLLTNYIQIYLEQNLNKRRKVSETARDWLNSEMQKVEKKLVQSLASLVNFTNRHGFVSLDDASSHTVTFFNRAAEELVKSKEQRVQLEAALNKDSASWSAAGIPNEARPPALTDFKAKLSQLEAQYAQMQEVYAEDYPKMAMLRKQMDFLKAKIQRMEESVVHAALNTAKNQEVLHQEAFDRAKKEAMNVNSLGVEYAILKKEVETNEQLYRILLQKSKEMDLNAQLIGNNAAVVDPPTVPLIPVRPKKGFIVLVGAAIGLIAGILSAFLLDQLDNTVRTTLDLEKGLKLPSLGAVPDIKSLRNRNGSQGDLKSVELVAYDSPKSPVSEAIRNIKTSIFLSMPAASINSLVVSSAMPAEGKTFIAVSIASVISSRQKRVLIVDADLRRPRVGQIFGCRRDAAGLTTLLTKNDVSLKKVIQRSRVPGLYFLSSGPLPPNPGGLLESERMRSLSDRFCDIFDLVVFDSPPVVGFADAQILAARADGVILVAKEGHVPLELLRQAKASMLLTKGKILGVVLNMARAGGYGYGYYGKYGYRSRYYYYHDYYASEESSLSPSGNGRGRKLLGRGKEDS